MVRMAPSSRRERVYLGVLHTSGRASPVASRQSGPIDPQPSERDAPSRSGHAALALIGALILGLVALRLGLSAAARISSALAVTPANLLQHQPPSPRVLELPLAPRRANGAPWRVLLIGLLLMGWVSVCCC